MFRKRLSEDNIGSTLVDIDRTTIRPLTQNFEFGLYPENTGYFDTGLLPNAYRIFELDCAFQDITTETLCGAQDVGQNLRFYIGVSNSTWRIGFGTNYIEYGTASTARKTHTLTGDGKWYVDGTLMYTFPGNISGITDTFKLWKRATYLYPKVVIYSLKVYENGELIYQLTPVRSGLYGHNATTPAVENGFWNSTVKQYEYPTEVPTTVMVYGNSNANSPNYRDVSHSRIDITATFVDFILTHKEYINPTLVSSRMELTATFRDFYETYTTQEAVTPTRASLVSARMAMEASITDLTVQTTSHINAYGVGSRMGLSGGVEEI